MSSTEPEPNINQALKTDRRTEPRTVPENEKHAFALACVKSEVRNESISGVCLAMPPAAEVEIGEILQISYEDELRRGRVCWTSIEHQNRKQLVGITWEG